jgi:hypothetical protein
VIRGTVFPDIAPSSRTPGQAYTRQLIVAQERVDAAFGDPQINVPHPYQQYKLTYFSDCLSAADLDSLRDHFALNAATFFSFFCFWSLRSIPKMKAADVVAGQLVYTLPASTVVTPTLYDGTGAVIAGSRYTLNSGAGAEGADNVTFVNLASQPTGPTLSFSAASGRRRFAAFYDVQQFPEAYEEGDVWVLGAPLQLTTSVTIL